MLNILIFDTETTGKDEDDQIIEISICKAIHEGKTVNDLAFHEVLHGKHNTKTVRIKPSVPIKSGAYEKHGISYDDLKDRPLFANYAKKLHELFRTADVIAGYNVKFDIQMIQQEFSRVGLKEIPFHTKTVIDPYSLWIQMEKRSLSDAYKRFTGKELENAHSATADVDATYEVMIGMLEEFGHQDATLKKISELCNPDKKFWIGPTYHLQWKNNNPIMSFGKKRDVAIFDVDLDYLRWIIANTENPFPSHVRQICKQVVKSDPQTTMDWIVENYGPPPEVPLLC